MPHLLTAKYMPAARAQTHPRTAIPRFIVSPRSLFRHVGVKRGEDEVDATGPILNLSKLLPRSKSTGELCLVSFVYCPSRSERVAKVSPGLLDPPSSVFGAILPGTMRGRSSPSRPRPARLRSIPPVRLRDPGSLPRAARPPECNRPQVRADAGIRHRRERDKPSPADPWRGGGRGRFSSHP